MSEQRIGVSSLLKVLKYNGEFVFAMLGPAYQFWHSETTRYEPGIED